jgi:hypothetical protein
MLSHNDCLAFTTRFRLTTPHSSTVALETVSTIDFTNVVNIQTLLSRQPSPRGQSVLTTPFYNCGAPQGSLEAQMM